ncbi:hypothetical protein OU789_07475 [Halocynthiibacter sp. C4]|uniref:DUF6778 family protein n=1 Tax=Halocynthiibacter sp. C4 TaxID=2992758 RepID=UPI00237B3793|nr:DUF6778 family protein [Halocynthiibacter sp. C4]MDE0589759.1 hypothetical protein [Halocynthiibacter sp. C4]
MSVLKATMAVAFAFVLAACSGGGKTKYEFPDGKIPQNTYTISSINISVPETLVVSEANQYYPNADIVWRGDPPGDRHKQVKAIFEEGMGRGAKALSGSKSVNVNVQVTRFHSLTERARYAYGGTHSIRFILSVTDAATGQPIAPAREVHADLEAFGGDDAVRADFNGQTQKVRVTNHLALVIQRELAVIYLEESGA